MVRNVDVVRPAALCHGREAADRLDDVQAARVEALRQFRTQQNLVEQVPVVVHVLASIVEVRSGGFTLRVPKVAPHRVVKERILATLDRSSATGRNTTRHHRIQAWGADNSGFKRIHVQVTDQYCPLVARLLFFRHDLSCQLHAFKSLAFSRPVQFAWQVRCGEQHRRPGRQSKLANRYPLALPNGLKKLPRESGEDGDLPAKARIRVMETAPRRSIERLEHGCRISVTFGQYYHVYLVDLREIGHQCGERFSIDVPEQESRYRQSAVLSTSPLGNANLAQGRPAMLKSGPLDRKSVV